MKYLVSLLISLILPPSLIGISSSSDKSEKNLSLAIFGIIALFLQINWGRQITAFNLLAIFISLLGILFALIFQKQFLEAIKIITKVFNNYINELRDPLLSTRDTIKILLIKDIAVLGISILGLIRPLQATILILGTIIYLIVVELILQDNTELRASYISFLNYIRNRGSLRSSENTDYREDHVEEITNEGNDTEYEEREESVKGRERETGGQKHRRKRIVKDDSNGLYEEGNIEGIVDLKGKKDMGTGR